MQEQLENIRDQQKAIWNRFSGGWAKWNDFNMAFLRPMGNAMIEFLEIKETDQVLDIATGTGEPGLTIAEIVKRGKVTATDISEEMLTIATHTAQSRGLSNFQTITADGCELPFPDGYFDVISCRMGFMFFADMQLAAGEMFRVLKPGGRMATSVWGKADKNPWVTKMAAVLAKNMDIPAPLPGAPGMFRCAGDGVMDNMLKTAGFKNIRTKQISGQVDYERPEQFWQLSSEVVAPVVNAMSRADESTREKIHQDTLNIFNDQQGKAVLDYSADIFYGEKG